MKAGNTGLVTVLAGADACRLPDYRLGNHFTGDNPNTVLTSRVQPERPILPVKWRRWRLPVWRGRMPKMHG
ncbi:hypothetical protein ACVXHB_23225 [Escherichia coli]